MKFFDLTRPDPDHVMCCICFETRGLEELFVDAENQRWDLCLAGTCAEEAGMR